MTKNIIIICLALIASLLLFRSCQSNTQLKNIASDLQAKSETIKTYRDSNQKLTSQVRSAEIYNSELITQAADLQTDLDEIKGTVTSATKVRYSTRIKEVIKTVPVYNTDTVYLVNQLNQIDTTYIFSTPIYTSVFNNDHINLSITSGQDSTNFDLTTFEEFEMITYTHRKFFKSHNEVLFKSLSPYAHNQKVQHYKLKEKPSHRFSLGLQAGYGITLHGFSPYAGLGLQYKIF